MPLFMDSHDLHGPVSAEEVAKAHAADLATQEEFSVRYERYWVDELGRADLAETMPPGPRHDLQRALGALAIMIGLGIVTVWFAVDEHRPVFLIALVAGLLLLMVAAWLNDRSLRLENRVKRDDANGMSWIEIRTLIEENDGG